MGDGRKGRVYTVHTLPVAGRWLMDRGIRQSRKGMICRLAVLLGSAALLMPLAEPVGQRSGILARTLLAMAATATATPAQAQAQKTPIPLVTNSDNEHRNVSQPRIRAQGFFVGDNNFILTSVQVGLTSTANKSTSVVIRLSSAGEPGREVGTLTPPDTLQDGLNTFTASTNIILRPKARYWVVVNEGIAVEDRALLQGTTSNSDTGLFGWFIDNFHLNKGIATWLTPQEDFEDYGGSDTSNRLRITINGYAEGDATAPTVRYGEPDPLEVEVPIEPLTPITEDTDIFSYSVPDDTLPPGLSLDQQTGVISGTPTMVSTSPVTVTVTVTDTGGNSTPVEITFSAVGAVGTLPPKVIEDNLTEHAYDAEVDGVNTRLATSQIVLTLSKDVTLSGSASDDLKAAFTVEVDGAELDGEDRGISTIFTLTNRRSLIYIRLSSLIADDAETVVVSYDQATAGDDGLEDENGNQMVSFTRFLRGSSDTPAVNTPPTVATPIPDQTATVGEPFEFMIPANTFEDADTGDTLSYTAALVGGNALPSWLTFAGDTFMGTPPPTAETLMVQVTATDGSGESVVDDFTITAETETVVEPMPTACPAPDFQADGRRQIWTGEVTVERDVAVYGFNGTVGSGALNDTTFAIGANNYGIRQASVDTDSDLGFRLESQESLTEKEKEELWLHVCDAVYEFDDAAFAFTPSRYIWSNTGLDWSGETMRTLYLSLPENRPATGRPEIGSDGSNQAGTTLSLGLTNVMDDDGRPDTFTYQWIRAGVDIPNATADEYMLTADDTNQPFRVRVSFTDQLGNEETVESLTWIGGSLNNAPTGADKTVTVNEDETYTFAVADFGFMDADMDGLDHVVIVTPPATGELEEQGEPISPMGVSLTAIDQEFLTYTPPENANGTGYASFTFRVNDSKDDSVEDYTITIDVTAVPDPPRLVNEIADQTATVGVPFTFMVPMDAFEDPDGDMLDYQARQPDNSLLPDWLTFDETTRTFTGTPTAQDVGTLTVEVKVSVPPDEASDEFDIVVSEMVMNTPPTAADNRVTVAEDQTYTFTEADFGFMDTDTGDMLDHVVIVTPPVMGELKEETDVLMANGAIPLLTVIDQGFLTYTPPADFNGDASFTFRVSDGTDESAASYTMTIEVTAVNDAPTVATPIPDQTATVNQTFTFTIPANTFEDADGDPLNYTAVLDDGSALPDWLTFDDTNQTFMGTPTTDETLMVRVTASDGTTSPVSDVFDITVMVAPGPDNGATGDPPGVSVSRTSLNLNEGQMDTYTLVLDTQPASGPVTITSTLTGDDSGAVSVSPASLTFTTSNWDTPRAVTVTTVEDEDANDEMVTISHSVSGYGSVTADDVMVTVREVDEAAQEAKAVLEEVALPDVLQQVTARTTEVIASRLNTIASGSLPTAPLTLSLDDVVADTVAFLYGERSHLKDSSLEWQQALAGRSFAFPLSSIFSGLTLAQGEGASPQEGLFSTLAIWGGADYSSYGNTVMGTDMDGSGFSGTIGMDLQPMPRLVTGLALTTGRWGLNYDTETNGASADGTYDVGITVVNPYLNWWATDQLGLWGSFGYGRGQVEHTPDGDNSAPTDPETDSFTNWAGGLRFEALPGADPLTGEGAPFGLAFKVDGAVSSFLDTDVQLARLAAEVSRSFPVETGLLNAALELGWAIRNVSDKDDLNDLQKRIADENHGGGAELAGRLHWLNGNGSLSATVDTRVLLSGDDRREWGIGGQLRITPSKRDGEGLSLSLQPSFGVTGTRLAELWSLSSDGDLAINNHQPDARLDAQLAYGFPLGNVLLTPYTEMAWAEATSTWGAGLRYGLNTSLELDLKGVHHSRTNGNTENRLLLELRSQL